MSTPRRATAGDGVSLEFVAWVESRLPAISAFWQEGPLVVEARDSAEDASGEAALAWRHAPWRTLTFVPGQTAEVALQDEHTLLVRSDEGTVCLQTLGGLRLISWRRPSRIALSVVLTEAVRARGGLSLHACGYVEPRQERLTAVVGRSGSGKSTHLVRQLEAGAKVVAEDTLWVSAASGECSSVDEHVRLWPENAHAPVTGLSSGAALPEGGVKRLWTVPWQRADAAGVGPRLGDICYLDNYRRQPLNTLPPLAQVRYLWEALGQPLLPAARRLHEAWVAAWVRGNL